MPGLGSRKFKRAALIRDNTVTSYERYAANATYKHGREDTLRFGIVYYVIRANKLLLIAECPRQLYKSSAVMRKKNAFCHTVNLCLMITKTPIISPTALTEKSFAMDTHWVFRDGVAQPVCQYLRFFPGGNAAGVLS